MRILKSLVFMFLILGILIIPYHSAAAEGGDEALLLDLKGPLTIAKSNYVSRALSLAQQQQAELIILQLDTPGGSIDLMSEIVSNIRGSSIPVVVYVSPRGAIAGSAGTVITLAGHVAAMAPETAIGAASPVGAQGEDIGETMEAKTKQIIKAQIRALAEDRRPPEAIAAAEDTVENASALSANEALAVGLVDIIAADLPDLLSQLDAYTVSTAAGSITLDTRYLTIKQIKPTLLEELLDILTNPNIVFLLLTLGLQAILIEIGSPGGWFAGFIGVTSLSLAAYGLGILPVNYFGLIFIITAFVLFILEIKAATHGALALAGVISFIVGALVLFNSNASSPDMRVSVPLVIGTAIFIAITFSIIITIAIRAQKAPLRMGQRSLIGKTGSVRVAIPLNGQGKVHLGGELWLAELAEGQPALPEGQRVEVVAVDGLRLLVKEKGK